MARGHFLEAIAVLDSLLSDRLASRLGHLTDCLVDVRRTTGQLCNQLVGKEGIGGCETDARLRVIVQDVQRWVERRNEALHATGKILRGDQPEVTFRQLLSSHKPNASEAIELLRKFDQVDTALRMAKGKMPATFPGAFDARRGPLIRETRASKRGSR